VKFLFLMIQRNWLNFLNIYSSFKQNILRLLIIAMDNSKKPINRFDTIERNLRLTKRKSMHEQN